MPTFAAADLAAWTDGRWTTAPAAVMGFDPMAGRGTAPFETCDNTLELAEQHGIGTRDLNRIEVAGFSITDALFSFRKA